METLEELAKLHPDKTGKELLELKKEMESKMEEARINKIKQADEYITLLREEDLYFKFVTSTTVKYSKVSELERSMVTEHFIQFMDDKKIGAKDISMRTVRKNFFDLPEDRETISKSEWCEALNSLTSTLKKQMK